MHAQGPRLGLVGELLRSNEKPFTRMIGQMEKFRHVGQSGSTEIDIPWTVLQDFPPIGHTETPG